MAHHHNDIDLDNAGLSSAIGIVVTFFIQWVLPWAIHTFSGLLTAITIADIVYRYNKWLKRNDK
jgi:heme O synthase-like polyprenyltransferase